jgi:phosphate uptake regulator
MMVRVDWLPPVVRLLECVGDHAVTIAARSTTNHTDDEFVQ